MLSIDEFPPTDIVETPEDGISSFSIDDIVLASSLSSDTVTDSRAISLAFLFFDLTSTFSPFFAFFIARVLAYVVKSFLYEIAYT